MRDVAIAMGAWREAATAHRDPRPEPAHPLHLSRTLAGRWQLDANLDPETGELLSTALRLAHNPDVRGEPARNVATRRAETLGDICRYFLDHQHTRRGGRHRPHLNVALDIARYRALGRAGGRTVNVTHLDRYRALSRAGASTVDGTHLDRASVERLPSSTTAPHTRTIPAPLYNALVVRDQHCRLPGHS